MQDDITQLEPDLFKRVTGLKVKDFELLASIGVFNESLMNDAIFKFRRYENASLEYTGINRHEGEKIGGWNTVVSKDDLDAIYGKEVEFDNSIMVGDFVWFNGKKVVVDKLNDSKIWLRDNGRRLDPVVLAKALESGSLSRTKPERKSEDEPVFEVTESKYEQHYIAFEAADDRNQTYEVTTSEVINPEPKPEPIVNNSEPIVFVEPPEGWSTDPRATNANPSISVGEKYENAVYGICTVSGLQNGRVDMRTSKGKYVTFIYPDAFVNGKLVKQ